MVAAIASTRSATDARAHLSAEQVKEVDKLVKQWQEQHRASPEGEAAQTSPIDGQHPARGKPKGDSGVGAAHPRYKII